MLKYKNELPPRVQAVKAKQKEMLTIHAPSFSKNVAKSKPTFAYSAKCSSNDDRSPYSLPQDHPQKTFISGYTGFVPRLQNHFGEPYTNSVRKAIEEFTDPIGSHRSKPTIDNISLNVQVKTHPIPGFTGFIPGAKYGYATTFGKTSEIAYENFNQRDFRGRLPPTNSEPKKNLSQAQPIPGYKGHIPQFIFSSERSYGVSTKECLEKFSSERENSTVTV
ncbi:hypothetical protein HK096_010834 [Nowakowskiella sp. JEL0078]|nr:hypothetical protein HK096_010834 [Nowakowskiella sp. JEL0078]